MIKSDSIFAFAPFSIVSIFYSFALAYDTKYFSYDDLRNLINSADARIAISTAIAQHWQMPTQNTRVINDACRKMNDACYVSNKEKYLLFSSYNLTEAKGTRTAIIAFAKSGVAKQGYILKLMGNCSEDYKVSLQTTIIDYNLDDQVEFVPCQTDIKPYFAHASGYIMASECEGLGRVTAEAMFYSCPVIAHASGGTLDLVKDGITGYLFHSVDECAKLIKKVCTTNQERMIMQAQRFAIDNLSQEVYGPKIMEVYKSVLNTKEFMRNPLVSVIVPNYNHARYLKQRLDTVFNQTYQNFEVIILDDKSTDNSLEIINQYKDNPHLSQIVVNEQNSGSPFKQWDKGIKLAKGELTNSHS